MKTRYVVTVILILFGIVPLAAQGDSWLGPQIGFYKARDAADVSGMGGAAMRLKLSEGFGIEGTVNYRQEHYYNGFVGVKSWPVMVTGLFYLAPTIYGALGAGWYNTSIEYNIPAGYYGGPATYTSETNQEFGWHFGGGVELSMSSAVILVADIKYVFLNYDFTNFPGSNGVNSNFYVMSVGLLFAL